MTFKVPLQNSAVAAATVVIGTRKNIAGSIITKRKAHSIVYVLSA